MSNLLLSANHVAATTEIPFQHKFFGQRIPLYLVGGVVFGNKGVENVLQTALLHILAHTVLVGALLDDVLLAIVYFQPLDFFVHGLRIVEVQLFVVADSIEQANAPSGRDGCDQIAEPKIGGGAKFHRVQFWINIGIGGS